VNASATGYYGSDREDEVDETAEPGSDELAGVVGHEIGHVAARHIVQQISRKAPFAVIASLGAGVTSIVSPLLGDLVGGLAGCDAVHASRNLSSQTRFRGVVAPRSSPRVGLGAARSVAPAAAPVTAIPSAYETTVGGTGQGAASPAGGGGASGGGSGGSGSAGGTPGGCVDYGSVGVNACGGAPCGFETIMTEVFQGGCNFASCHATTAATMTIAAVISRRTVASRASWRRVPGSS
jgi:hypothetical protein